MSLASSLYSGITGLSAHGERMTVIGNNLANVSTTAYKGANMYFEDLMSQNVTTANGTAQVGRGVRVASIYSDFSQGSFETTNEATDMAIGGDGFFMVSPTDSEETYYTRAGVFRFDNDGYLVDTNGYVLQGWAMERNQATVATSGSTEDTSEYRTVGSITDIKLENFQSPPQATSAIDVITNLDPGATDSSTSTTNPYFALMQNWDGLDSDNDGEALSDGDYAYSTSIKVYDEIGTSHTVTVYFDPVTTSNSGGYTAWEYIVTCDPSEDGRIITASDGSTVKMSETSCAGLLMTGTLTFRAGQLVGQSSYTLQSGENDGNVGELSNWKLADFNTDGYVTFTANFLGTDGASSTNMSIDSNASPIGINFGLKNSASSIDNSIGAGWSLNGGTPGSNAALVGSNVTDISDTLPTFESPTLSALATQSYDTGGSTTLYQSQDGYTAGVLQSVSVSTDGVLSGTFSNGQEIQLYAVALATFTSTTGLEREGSNLFSETSESGSALTGMAGDQGKGTISGNSLELSNVDMATELVNMITTQRGFQASTKMITTADSLLGEVISMKR